MMHRHFRFPSWPGFTIFLLLAGTPAWPAAEAPRDRTLEVETIKDVAYYDGADAHPVKHKLDLYIPKGQKDFPVLLFVHGGSWRHGDKNGQLGTYSNIGSFYARHGIGTVVINYRLSPQVKHPEHIKDVARAFAWTHKNIGKYGGKADQVFVCGHSAGAHLVSLLVTDNTYLKMAGLGVEDVRGVIAMSGVYDLGEKLFPSVFGTDSEVRRKASPIRQVKAGLPPFLILYADDDFPGCGREPSAAFARALKEKSNKVETMEITDSNHYKMVLSAAVEGEAVPRAVLKFIDRAKATPSASKQP
jgi:acetyl esterase/lipase